MAFPPEAYIIGAQKAGTTSLAFLLGNQPGITLSEPKETRYFADNLYRGVGWYRARFNGPESSVFLDASPAYAAAPTKSFPLSLRSNDPRAAVPHRIYAANPDARFIYILRDPVDRVYAAYWHDRRAGHIRSDLQRTIRERPVYLRASDYAGQIQNYLQYFSLQQFLLVDFLNLVSRPMETVQTCCDFLDVPYDEQPSDSLGAKKNKSYQLSGLAKILRAMSGSHENFARIANLARSVVPKWMENSLMTALIRPIPPLDERDRQFIAQYLRESKEELSELTGFDVAHWN
jgi:hypothetical protein